MPPVQVLYHWIPLAKLNLMSYIQGLVHLWLLSYHSFYLCLQLQACHRCESYTIRFVSSTRFQLYTSRLNPPASCWVTFRFVLLFSGQVSSDCFLHRATSIPLVRALYHSIPHVRRIVMVYFPTRSDHWLRSYLLVCTFVHQASTSDCFLQSATSMLPVQVLYSSICLVRRILMICFLTFLTAGCGVFLNFVVLLPWVASLASSHILFEFFVFL